MFRHLIATILDSAFSGPSAARVHFHTSEHGRQYACYDTSCDQRSLNPRGVIS